MRPAFIVLALVLAACGADAGVGQSTTTESPATTTTLATVTFEQLPLCPAAELTITRLPEGFAAEGTDPDLIARDVYTSVPGTWSAVWADADGDPVMSLVRGTLPPESWVGITSRLTVAGRQAALGPLPDGVWGVAWFESENRCDLYTLVLYPPATADDARQVAESIEKRR